MLNKSSYGQLIAFEPNPLFFDILKDIFNKYNNLIIENCALYDKAGNYIYFFYENNPWESGLSKREKRIQKEGNQNGNILEIPVKTKILDEYLDSFESLDLIKMDTELAEMNILLGGENLIKKFRPILLIEFQDDIKYFNHTKSELYEYTEKLDYYLCDLFGNIFYNKEVREKYPNGVIWDFLVIPKEKYNDVKERIKY